MTSSQRSWPCATVRSPDSRHASTARRHQLTRSSRRFPFVERARGFVDGVGYKVAQRLDSSSTRLPWPRATRPSFREQDSLTGIDHPTGRGMLHRPSRSRYHSWEPRVSTLLGELTRNTSNPAGPTGESQKTETSMPVPPRDRRMSPSTSGPVKGSVGLLTHWVSSQYMTITSPTDKPAGSTLRRRPGSRGSHPMNSAPADRRRASPVVPPPFGAGRRDRVTWADPAEFVDDAEDDRRVPRDRLQHLRINLEREVRACSRHDDVGAVDPRVLARRRSRRCPEQSVPVTARRLV